MLPTLRCDASRWGRALARSALLLALSAGLGGCGDDSGVTPTDGGGGSGAAAGGSPSSGGQDGGGAPPTSGQPDEIDLYGSSIDTLELEIDYAPGAEPYTGEVLGFGELWNLFQANAERLFQGRGKTFVIPRELAQMEAIAVEPQESYTQAEILAIADQHRDQLSGGGRATFYILFLDGYYQDDGAVNESVLGISITNSGVIVMFKPVIAATGVGLPGQAVEKYVEQTVLIHEFGHAVGLVDNGVPMAAPHSSGEHGRHCDNDECLMYYASEGSAGAIEFVTQHFGDDTTILFDADCLADVDAAMPAR